MLLRFVTRAFYSFNLYMGEQLPEEYGLRIDMDEFLSSFSAIDDHGVRRRVGTWPSGPGFRKASAVANRHSSEPASLPTDDDSCILAERVVEEMVSQADYRESLNGTWTRYLSHVGGHIPYAVCKSNGLAAIDSDDASVERTGFDDNDNDEEDIEVDTSSKDKGGRPSRMFKFSFSFHS